MQRDASLVLVLVVRSTFGKRWACLSLVLACSCASTAPAREEPCRVPVRVSQRSLAPGTYDFDIASPEERTACVRAGGTWTLVSACGNRCDGSYARPCPQILPAPGCRCAKTTEPLCWTGTECFPVRCAKHFGMLK